MVRWRPKGRVTGPARQLFLDMHAIALRSPPVGADLDVAPNFPRLAEIAVPARVICGDFEFPHIQERCRQIVPMMPNGSHRALAGAAHLASLDRPAEITSLLAAFLDELKA
jgi:pimeloyl-ACP methyl ester carboxylesterase